MLPNVEHQITITVCVVNNHVNFTYQPSVLHACPGDTIVWHSPHGPFAVEFKEDTPGESVGVHGEQLGPHWQSAQFPIRIDARGHYHYAVAVALNAAEFVAPVQGRVALDAACPEIIVN
jgi:hypothetical protein